MYNLTFIIPVTTLHNMRGTVEHRLKGTQTELVLLGYYNSYNSYCNNEIIYNIREKNI